MKLLVLPAGSIIAAGEPVETATVFEYPDQVVPKAVLPDGYAFVDVAVPPDFSLSRWRYIDGELAPVALAEDEKAALKGYAASKRWDREQGGLMLGDIRVATDTTSMFKIRELKDNVAAGLIAVPFGFKAENGWADVDAPTIAAVYEAMVAHVQDCYTRERTVCQGIDAGDVRTTAAIDAAFA